MTQHTARDRIAPNPNTPVQVIHGWASYRTADDLAIPPPPRVPVHPAHQPALLARTTAIARITMAAIVGLGTAFWVALLWLAIDKAVSLSADPPPVAFVQPRRQA
jgi:type IV secretory pathway TrbD component